MVYIISIDNKPLMPTKRFGKVRRLLKEKKAEVVNLEPFTIKLLYKTETEEVQDITLGIDAGSKTVGLSAGTDKEEVFSAELILRDDIVKKLSDRREQRRTRRSRLKYRKARFSNRVKTKKKGWLAPSVRHKIDSHLSIIDKVYNILPVSKIIVEVAQFDIQKIKNPDISGKEYQEGEQKNFWNVREFVLHRDNHKCQHCKGKKKDKILQVHHLESRKTGGNAPNNLVTLCSTCHKDYHNGKTNLKIKRGKSFKDASFMGIMRWTFYDKLKEKYKDKVSLTYGYITKSKRIGLGLEKTHYNDAYCIANNLDSKKLDYYYLIKKVRCHNRQIHKSNKRKGNKLIKNQAPYKVKGFRLFDKVSYQNKNYFIFGRRQSGYFDIRDLQGNKVKNGSISYRKLKFIEEAKYYLVERIA